MLSEEKENARIQATERPVYHIPMILNSLRSVINGCDMSRGRIIDHHGFENGYDTDNSYENKLDYNAFLPFKLLQADYIFQQNSAPPHFPNFAGAYLKTKSRKT